MHPTDFSSNLHEFTHLSFNRKQNNQHSAGWRCNQKLVRYGNRTKRRRCHSIVTWDHFDSSGSFLFFCFLFLFSKWLVQDQIEAVKSCATLGCLMICIRYQIYDRYLMLFTIISWSYHSHVFLPSILRIQRDVSKKSRHLGRASMGWMPFQGKMQL